MDNTAPVKSIAGSTPGVLDSSQTSRVVQIAGSTLTFATFDQSLRSGNFKDQSGNLIDDLDVERICRSRRIVVETSQLGINTWRFVPYAILENGVNDDGLWPRIINVCGERIICSRDQWDIYNLDPEYECRVRIAPHLSTITRFANTESVPRFTFEAPKSPVTSQISLKRRFVLSPRLRRPTGDDDEENAQKRFRAVPSEEDSDMTRLFLQAESNRMVVDGKLHLHSERLKKVRANIEEARKLRRKWYEEWKDKRNKEPEPVFVDMDQDTDMLDVENMYDSDEPWPMSSKRKVSTSFALDSDTQYVEEDWEDESEMTSRKRGREMSPSSIRRCIIEKKTRRHQKRRDELSRRFKQQAEAKWKAMMEEMMTDFQREASSIPNENVFGSESTLDEENRYEPNDGKDAEDAAREAAIQESIRKMKELEADRPLWEEQARLRRAREEEEKRKEDRKRAMNSQKLDARRDGMESNSSHQESKVDPQEEARRKRLEREENRRIAKQQARKDIKRYAHGHWNARIALARYQEVSERFDKANFHAGEIVLFETVPWPTLSRPGSYNVEDIDWATVENFFIQVRRLLSPSEFKTLVEKSHKRFHPDRWRSRRVLQSVDDEEEKECLEEAANTVAQALTPLWTTATGR